MRRLIAVGLLSLSCGGSAPAVPLVATIARKDLALSGGTGLALSVRQPVTQAQVQALIDANRSSHALVRVFAYATGIEPGQGRPAALYEWTPAEGLKKKY